MAGWFKHMGRGVACCPDCGTRACCDTCPATLMITVSGATACPDAGYYPPVGGFIPAELPNGSYVVTKVAGGMYEGDPCYYLGYATGGSEPTLRCDVNLRKIAGAWEVTSLLVTWMPNGGFSFNGGFTPLTDPVLNVVACSDSGLGGNATGGSAIVTIPEPEEEP